MTVPYRLERRRVVTGRPCELALVHPSTGAELGRIIAADEGYLIRLPNRETGICDVQVPTPFPTVYMARECILEHHGQESEN